MRATLAARSHLGSAEVFALQSQDIASYWHLIEPLLSRVEDGDWTLEGVRAELEAGKAQLWGFEDHRRILGVWITKLEETSKGRRGLLWIAAGEGLNEGLRLFREHTEPWLKQQGCKSIQILGRKGWERVLPEYRNAGIVLVRDL